MLTYPKSRMRFRRMPMHLSSGHVTLMPGKFYPPNFPQSDLGRRADSRWALPQISSFNFQSDKTRQYGNTEYTIHDNIQYNVNGILKKLRN